MAQRSAGGGPNITIEGVRQLIDAKLKELVGSIDRSSKAVASKVATAEAAIHKRATADHAATNKVCVRALCCACCALLHATGCI